MLNKLCVCGCVWCESGRVDWIKNEEWSSEVETDHSSKPFIITSLFLKSINGSSDWVVLSSQSRDTQFYECKKSTCQIRIFKKKSKVLKKEKQNLSDMSQFFKPWENFFFKCLVCLPSLEQWVVNKVVCTSYLHAIFNRFLNGYPGGSIWMELGCVASIHCQYEQQQGRSRKSPKLKANRLKVWTSW